MTLNHQTSEDKAHADYSASGSERWLNCPGSIELSKSAPPAPESKYAAEGTKAHACFEFLLKNRTNFKNAVKVAKRNFDQEMVTHAKEAVEWILAEIGDDESVDVLCETKIDSSYFTCEGQFGTLDAAIVREFGRLTVIDYKYGAGVIVDPGGKNGDGNSQLIYYALGVSALYHHNFSEVELVVIQPRAYTESGEVIRSFVLSIDDLLKWIPFFQNGVAQTKVPQPTLKSGSYCKFCPATPICSELKDKAFKDAQVVFADETGIESVPEPTMIQMPNLSTILSACDKLETWIEKVRAHAFHVLERGEEVPGFKLVEKRGTRKWKNLADTEEKAQKLFGNLAFTEPELKSPAQLEKVLTGPNGKAFIAEHAEIKSSGFTLVPESDKRPAVNPAAKAFADGSPAILIAGRK